MPPSALLICLAVSVTSLLLFSLILKSYAGEFDNAVTSFTQAASPTLAAKHARAVFIQLENNANDSLALSKYTSAAILGAWHDTLGRVKASDDSRAERHCNGSASSGYIEGHARVTVPSWWFRSIVNGNWSEASRCFLPATPTDAPARVYRFSGRTGGRALRIVEDSLVADDSSFDISVCPVQGAAAPR